LTKSKKNDFNLNIPRYVDTFEPEPEIDLRDVAKELRDIDQQINENEKELVGMLKELTSSDDDIMAGLQSIIEDFEEEIR
jgi:type I restriction enzyme M protein